MMMKKKTNLCIFEINLMISYSHRVAKICTEERNIENILARTNFNKIGSKKRIVGELNLKKKRKKN